MTLRRWRTAYFILANTALLIVAVQLAAHAAITAYQAVARARLVERPPEWAYTMSPHLTRADVEELWRLTGWMPFRYGGAAGFLHERITSRFININGFGIRSNGDPRRPMSALQGATWFFGGSTTFGFGVVDSDTIPAQLEQMLGTPVINFGVRGHGSTMENRLFNYYLRAGYRPARALFLDGINEVCEPDLFSPQLARLTARVQQGYAWEFGKPVVFAATNLRRLFTAPDRPPGRELALECDDQGRRNPLSAIVARTLAERDAVCRLYGVPCQTFVQPFGGVHGRHDDRAFVNSVEAQELRDLFAHLQPTWQQSGARFVTTALDGVDRHMWVDEIHYSPEGSRLIAAAISRHVASPERAPTP